MTSVDVCLTGRRYVALLSFARFVFMGMQILCLCKVILVTACSCFMGCDDIM